MPLPPLSKLDTRNILDNFKGWQHQDIENAILQRMQGFSVAMFQLAGDFNFSSVVRSANAFGAERVYYIGRRKWDKRGAVGTYNYTDIVHCKDLDDFYERIDSKAHTVAIENNIDYPTTNLINFTWPDNPILILGEEGQGLSDEVLCQVDYIVTIPQFGSVRSLNAASAATVVMYDYLFKKEQKS